MRGGIKLHKTKGLRFGACVRQEDCHQWSLRWEVAYLSGEEISKAFLTQLPHVTLGETENATLDIKHFHEEYHKDTTIVPTTGQTQ